MDTENCTNLYLQVCQTFLTSDPDKVSSYEDLYRLLPWLRQSLTCCVCADVAVKPMSSTNSHCQHFICKMLLLSLLLGTIQHLNIAFSYLKKMVNLLYGFLASRNKILILQTTYNSAKAGYTCQSAHYKCPAALHVVMGLNPQSSNQ